MRTAGVLLATAPFLLGCASSGSTPTPESLPAQHLLLDVRYSTDLTGAFQRILITSEPGDPSGWVHVYQRKAAGLAVQVRSLPVSSASVRALLAAIHRDGLLEASSGTPSCADCNHFSGIVVVDGQLVRFWFPAERMPRNTVAEAWPLGGLSPPP